MNRGNILSVLQKSYLDLPFLGIIGVFLRGLPRLSTMQRSSHPTIDVLIPKFETSRDTK
jgi:hypothetical protein